MNIPTSAPARISLLLLLSALLAWTGVSRAQGSAMEQLLRLLERKGAVTHREAASIRHTLDREEERLHRKERAFREKERRLADREKKLREREAAARQRERTSSGTQAVFPASETTEKTENPRTVRGGLPAPPVQQLETRSQIRSHRGFCLQGGGTDHGLLCLGAFFQLDYRYFKYESDQDPEKNKFDIRRARLRLCGQLLRRFSYKFLYEFQGAGSRRLLDAYIDTRILPGLSLRVGQFKEPFGLEQVSRNGNLPFAERSMGFYLTPGRDLGAMAHGSFWNHRVSYGLGLFNGDGMDDATMGDVDSPECTGTVTLAPFHEESGTPAWWGEWCAGGAFSYARADRSNVNINAKTTGLTSFFNVNSSAKFNVIRDAGTRTRYELHVAWSYGPVLLWGEFTNLRFSDIRTSAHSFDIDIKETYGAVLWMVTGERPGIRDGIFQPIAPYRSFGAGGWGAWGVAFRYDVFDAGSSAYEYLINKGDSVRKATAYTLALNWYLNPNIRFILDATRTVFDVPLLIDRDSLTGEAVTSDCENVFTGRIQFQF